MNGRHYEKYERGDYNHLKKRYWVFETVPYDNNGGLDDVVYTTDDLEEAKKVADDIYRQIYDSKDFLYVEQ